VNFDLALTFGSLAAIALWEVCWPRRRHRFPAFRRRVGNIGFWLFNTTAAAVLIVEPDELRAPWRLPSWLGLILGFLLLDLTIYAVHRTYHAVPLLWRLHALHHSDPDIDWSTAVRHHPLEYLLNAGVYWLAILAIGIPGPVVAAHALCVFVLAVATHGNVRWPGWLERALQPGVITLDLHLVHHSVEAAEANANFGAVLSVWDRLFGTFAPLSREPVFGVRELDPRDACKPAEMLLTPLRIGKMAYTTTHDLGDGRAVEVSAERRGDRLRLRASLTRNDVVEAAHRQDYNLSTTTITGAIADFTGEFEQIVGTAAPCPLFPEDLFASG
jgi:sterol desaturase/sphingolipid hydroxylase (fatty acid hydroxylase superfamily)